MGEWAKAVLLLSVGKRGGGKVFLMQGHVPFDRCNWGVETCMHTHSKSMMSVQGDSQWMLLNTYTDIALPARQQGEIVKLSWRGISLLLFFSHLCLSLVQLFTPYLCYIWLSYKMLLFPSSNSWLPPSNWFSYLGSASIGARIAVVWHLKLSQKWQKHFTSEVICLWWMQNLAVHKPGQRKNSLLCSE